MSSQRETKNPGAIRWKFFDRTLSAPPDVAQPSGAISSRFAATLYSEETVPHFASQRSPHVHFLNRLPTYS